MVVAWNDILNFLGNILVYAVFLNKRGSLKLIADILEVVVKVYYLRSDFFIIRLVIFYISKFGLILFNSVVNVEFL